MEWLVTVWLPKHPKLLRFWSNWNFCESLDGDGNEKPPSRLYDAFMWWVPECRCCTAVRFFVFGLIAGWIIWR